MNNIRSLLVTLNIAAHIHQMKNAEFGIYLSAMKLKIRSQKVENLIYCNLKRELPEFPKRVSAVSE